LYSSKFVTANVLFFKLISVMAMCLEIHNYLIDRGITKKEHYYQ
jgi:hypothetical protein